MASSVIHDTETRVDPQCCAGMFRGALTFHANKAILAP